MKRSRRRLLKAALIIVISAAVLLAVAGPILSAVFSNKIKASLEAANVHFSSLSINLYTRSITLRDVDWSDKSRKAKVAVVYAGGIGIFPYVSHKQISIRRLNFEGGELTISRDTVEHSIKIDSLPISSIDVDRITIKDFDVAVKNDTIVEFKANVGIVVHFFFVSDPQNFRDPAAYTMRNIETTVEDLKITKAGSLYDFTIKKGTFDKELKTLHIDSLKLEPIYSKTEFAKIVKSQETRTTLNVASVNASGVNMAVHLEDTSFMVSAITIKGATVHAYKNKKYPFKRTEKFPLPMVSFQSLKWGIEVDTVRILDSKITYEELPTEGFNYAHITFMDVEATMSSVNNREYKNMEGVAILEASAKVMKTGSVKATFKLPLQADKKYSAEGTIRNVPLSELNPLLTDLAFVEIASGTLNKMDFAFEYNDVRSRGQVHFDYENLKIRGLKKQRDHELNAFKTALINVALKNDETLTGQIDILRNQNKAVFNLWTISLVDGIKDAMIPGNTKKKLERKKKK